LKLLGFLTFRYPKWANHCSSWDERTPKGLYGYDMGKGTTHVINYHKAKGREFDVVVLVDPRGESTRTPLQELRRLYYVCATRTKDLLFVVYLDGDEGRVLGPVLKG